MKTHQYHVVGMHCKACVHLTETELKNHPEVKEVVANLSDCSVCISGDFGERDREVLLSEFDQYLKPHGYSLSLDKPTLKPEWSEFKTALPIAIIILALLYFLQRLGVINLVNTESLSYSTAILVGLVASLSTCMAVVGGLLLSLSSTLAREGGGVRPQIMFHGGRLLAFFVLGGVIGVLGSAFTLSGMATFILGVIIGLVMLIMGFNLLDVFPWSKKLMPSMPKFLSRSVVGASAVSHSLMPFLVGVATFFLPCGFTQAMQIYTLSTGSFLAGGLTMLAFALGTLPVLALISFSSFSIKDISKRGIFFKTTGIIVIVFAVFNILNSLAAIGFIKPIFNF